ncbi:MAG: hypothetical protein QM811_16720 [Pirellulales bacterium]
MGHNRGRLLAAETVRSIKRAIGTKSIAAIGRDLRVGRTTIYRIINGDHTLASVNAPLSAQSVAPTVA